jgi:hypothetical protein
MTQKKQFRKRNCGGGFTVCVTVPAASLLLLACFFVLLHSKIVGKSMDVDDICYYKSILSKTNGFLKSTCPYSNSFPSPFLKEANASNHKEKHGKVNPVPCQEDNFHRADELSSTRRPIITCRDFSERELEGGIFSPEMQVGKIIVRL